MDFKSNRRGRGRGKGKRGAAATQQLSLPPRTAAAITIRHRFVFATQSTVNKAVTALDIAGACGGVCTVANASLRLWATSARLHDIVIYPSGNQGFASAPNVQWTMSSISFSRDEIDINPLPAGITVTRSYRYVPPPNSLAVDWMNLANLAGTTLMMIDSNAGDIIYLDVSFTLANIFGLSTATIATGTLGGIYYLALDGPSSNKFVPLGVPTTS